jgi:site-specific DNA recombinase
MKIAIYARVSTQSQAKQETIQSQLEALREYAQAHDLTITQECIDNGVSGSTLEREGLDELRDLVLAGEVKGVLILSPDRLSRTQFDQMVLMEEFKKHKIKVFFTNQQFEDTPAGNLMLQVHGAFAEFERAKIADRTRRGTKHAVKNGQVLGINTPYGYRFVRKSATVPAHWEVDPREAELVHLVFDLYINKRMKGAGIARHLESKGILTRAGSTRWRGSVVNNILKNETYLGTAYMFKHEKVKPKKSPKVDRYRSNKKTADRIRPREEWIGIPVTALIDKKTWDAAQDLLKKNAYRARRNNHKNKYLLRGLVLCGECGSMASGYVSNKKTYYSCGAKRNKNITTKPHDNVNIATRHQPFDAKVWQGLVELLQDPENIKRQMSKRLTRNNASSKSTKSAQTKVEKEIQKLAVQEKRILDAYRESIIEIDELKEQKSKITERRKVLNAQQKAALSQLERSGRPEITMAMLGDVSARFQSVMAKADFAAREKMANLLINSVILHKDKAIVTGNIPVTKTDVLKPSNHGFGFGQLLGDGWQGASHGQNSLSCLAGLAGSIGV